MHAAVVVVFYIASLWLSLARCLIVKLELFGHELSLHLQMIGKLFINLEGG